MPDGGHAFTWVLDQQRVFVPAWVIILGPSVCVHVRLSVVFVSVALQGVSQVAEFAIATKVCTRQRVFGTIWVDLCLSLSV